ncbi:hypothetical protein CPB83DRAFT_895778 [Crepidotus variabilis]|uniref:Glucose receptor Git3 N-terminal domain-containing protein n=1 Tax=Crepidotus variabilis TaxID=179855 RepID=A0A9P6JNR6_9AGAR|nr:hypothetical protein CPB83DRAFT_895778 [Crepidotus variabilis]
MPSGVIFNFSERVGLLFSIESGIASILASTFVLSFALFKWLKRTVNSWGRGNLMRSDASDSGLFLNLMFADLIQACGWLPNIKWMVDATITDGHLCTAQAVLKQVGLVGTCLTSLAIALHTFGVLVLRWKPSRHLNKAIILCVWVVTALIVIIPAATPRNEPLYGPAGFWCFITPRWKTLQLTGMYLWIWIAAFSMLILYSIMFGVMRGWLNIGGSPNGEAPVDSEEDKQAKAIAKMMLFFPAVYIFTILPNSLARWLTTAGHDIPSEFILFGNTVFGSSGFLNFILFLLTRPAIVIGETITVEHVPNLPLHSPSISKHSYSDTSHMGQLPDFSQGEQREQRQSSHLSDGDVHQPSPTAESPFMYHLAATGRPYGRSKGAQLALEDDDESYGRLPS